VAKVLENDKKVLLNDHSEDEDDDQTDSFSPRLNFSTLAGQGYQNFYGRNL
jgi:hypothetical protein